MYKRYLVKKKGDEMLAAKKTAKDLDVLKAVMRLNKKHFKMLSKLAK